MGPGFSAFHHHACPSIPTPAFLPLLLPKGQVQMPLRNALGFLLFQPGAQVLDVREGEEMKGFKLCGLVSLNQRVQRAPEPIQGHRDRSLVPLSPFCPQLGQTQPCHSGCAERALNSPLSLLF